MYAARIYYVDARNVQNKNKKNLKKNLLSLSGDQIAGITAHETRHEHNTQRTSLIKMPIIITTTNIISVSN